MKHSLTIYDDALFYMQGLSNMLVQDQVFHSVHHFNNQKDFIDHYHQKPTDFVIHGTQRGSVAEIIDNLFLVSSINDKVKMTIIGNYYDLNDIRKLFEKGIQCYLDKDTSYDEFLNAMKVLKSDNIYLCNSAKERMIGYVSNQNEAFHQSAEALTKREKEVMKLICDGNSSKIISEKLFISINTVETHRKKILMKLNVKNSVGIVKYAVENNMLE